MSETKLSKDSPFRHLPVDLPRKQVLFFDALRISAQMTMFAYENLEHILKYLMTKEEGSGTGEKAIEGIFYAYGVIDASYRFIEVLKVAPSIKHNEIFEVFIRSTADVEKLRHIIQHLNGELREISNRNAAALGTITWLGPSLADNSPPTAWMLQPGSIYPRERTFGPIIDLVGRVAPGEIAQVCLTTNRVRINLSDLIRRVREMLARLEPSLSEQSKGKELLGSDVLLQLSLLQTKQTK